MNPVFSEPTTAAIILLCAGVIHNYSFMCRKVPAATLNAYYPATPSGKFLFNLSWMSMAGYGFLLCSKISTLLFWVAVAVYFLLLPFLLQPQLARLLGFKSLSDYIATVDEQQNRTDRSPEEPPC